MVEVITAGGPSSSERKRKKKGKGGALPPASSSFESQQVVKGTNLSSNSFIGKREARQKQINQLQSKNHEQEVKGIGESDFGSSTITAIVAESIPPGPVEAPALEMEPETNHNDNNQNIQSLSENTKYRLTPPPSRLERTKTTDSSQLDNVDFGGKPNDSLEKANLLISHKQDPNNTKPPKPLHVDNMGDEDSPFQRNMWLFACFVGMMFSFVCYGLLMEYATSGGRKLHELSFLFVTSLLYTITAAAGRHVRDESPTSIPPARFAVLGVLSMGSTFCSVRSLRYVIYPIQVLAKSCKPVPVMIIGALMGKKYPPRKYINVLMIVSGVALFMGGSGSKKGSPSSDIDSGSQIFGIILLFVSLCFDGGTGAYEDKLMSVHSVGPFDLMYNIQLGKTLLAGISLLVLNQVHIFVQMCQDMGFLLIALGLSGALGQVFIFVTIAKFGALTCSIIGLARKVTTLVVSIWFYGHHLAPIQVAGLVIAVTAMVLNFWGKKEGGKHGEHCPSHDKVKSKDIEMQPLGEESESSETVETVPLKT